MANAATEHDSRLNTLAVYQFICGLLGLITSLIFLFGEENLILLIVKIVFLLLYTHALYCGIILFRKKETAIRHTLVNLYFQLISFSFLGYAFKYVSGLCLDLGINFSTGFQFSFDLSFSTWKVNLGVDEGVKMIHINVIALFLIIYLNSVRRAMASDKDEEHISTIGTIVET